MESITELMKMRLASLDSTDFLNRDVYDDSDWKMGTLWRSSLAPTSRSSHVERHGLIYTTDEVREFYKIDDNSENCLCSQSAVLFNVKTGEVLQTELIERMLLSKKAYLDSK